MNDRERQVVITHWVHPEVLDALARFCRPTAPAERDVMPRDEVIARLGDAVGVVVSMADHVDEEFLAAGPRLRIVSATLKGYDNIDIAACTQRGIWATNLPVELTRPAAEHAMALILGLLRRVGEGDRRIREGGYEGWRPRLYGFSLADATVGIIGMGAVGRALAGMLAAFGARIIFSDTTSAPNDTDNWRQVSLPELLTSSDVVVPLVPLSPQTGHLLDTAAIASTRPGTYLVNVGRGSVVDEEAVANALETGHLAGYAADVFAMEDWAQPERPQRIPERLLKHPRTLFTPHLGTAVHNIRREMSLAAARQVEDALAGRRPGYALNEVSA
ncbi:NAD(P)-dependent oxidoreductase [Spirillospora sp. NPDC048911]|uniref:NAD(P)-dependent oxidoreductase n=1 Tax=Spirillospora sp. NPDC048911 TaxID=3364527 RepID=UPI003724903D